MGYSPLETAVSTCKNDEIRILHLSILHSSLLALLSDSLQEVAQLVTNKSRLYLNSFTAWGCEAILKKLAVFLVM